MARRLFLALLLVIVAFSTAQGQMSKFKALYLFQFAKSTNWSAADNGKPFVITIIGDQALTQDLKAVVGNKLIGDRKITINEAATPVGLPKSEIIYLGESKSAQLSKLLDAQRSNSVLIVCGGKGLCAQGAGISFSPDNGKLNFDISENNIGRYGLKVSPKLVTLGHQVN